MKRSLYPTIDQHLFSTVTERSLPEHVRCAPPAQRRDWAWAGALSLLLAGYVLWAMARAPWIDPDLFHGMALWRETLRTGSFPRADLWAYTPTLPQVVHHEWGMGALLYTITIASGWAEWGLFGLKLLLVTALVVACTACARKRGASLLLIVILAVVPMVLLGIAVTTIRAQLFTLLFTALLLLFLEADRKGRRWWMGAWLLLFVIWLNLHAGFVVGAGLYMLYSAERFAHLWMKSGIHVAFRYTKHLVLVGAAMLLLLGVNPYGWELPVYVWNAVRMERPTILEWRPVWTDPPYTAVFIVSVLLAAYGVFHRGWRSSLGLPLLVVAAYLGTQHIRHATIYAVIWFCYVPGYLMNTPLQVWLSSMREKYERQTAVGAASIGLLLIAAAATTHFWDVRLPTRSGQWAFHYPTGAVDYLERSAFSGNVVTPFTTGAYVSWRLYPAVRVSFDGRYEVAYPSGAMESNQTVYGAREGWLDMLGQHGADAVLIPIPSRLDSSFVTVSPPMWPEVYRDNTYAVRVRSERAAEFAPEFRAMQRATKPPPSRSWLEE